MKRKCSETEHKEQEVHNMHRDWYTLSGRTVRQCVGKHRIERQQVKREGPSLHAPQGISPHCVSNWEPQRALKQMKWYLGLNVLVKKQRNFSSCHPPLPLLLIFLQCWGLIPAFALRYIFSPFSISEAGSHYGKSLGFPGWASTCDPPTYYNKLSGEQRGTHIRQFGLLPQKQT